MLCLYHLPPHHDGGAHGDGTQPRAESGTLDTVEIAGLIADDQRLFTPSAQVTPKTCKKAVFACLDTNVTFASIYNAPRLELRLRRDVE